VKKEARHDGMAPRPPFLATLGMAGCGVRVASCIPSSTEQVGQVVSQQILNERQQTARALARAIEDLGAWVTSALPLDDQQKLRFQLLDSDKNRVLQAIRDLGFGPVFVTIKPRVDVTSYGFLAACDYEIDLPRPRPPIIDDRKIYGEIATKEKPSRELEGFREYMGLKK
jgi:hypothetical protein